MILCDVNILVYAHRSELSQHSSAHKFVQELLHGGTFAVSPLILSGFLRIVTHPKVFKTPTPISTAMSYTEAIASAENAVELQPSADHWEVFTGLVRKVQAKGNFIPDCYLAALAIEHGCTFATTDRNFSRFKNLQLRFLETG